MAAWAGRYAGSRRGGKESIILSGTTDVRHGVTIRTFGSHRTMTPRISYV